MKYIIIWHAWAELCQDALFMNCEFQLYLYIYSSQKKHEENWEGLVIKFWEKPHEYIIYIHECK